MRHTLKTFLFAVTLAATLPASAQLPVVDITWVMVGNNQVEIRVRPDADFTEFFAALVFTLRWNNADGANLGSIVQNPDASNYFFVQKSGGEQFLGSDRHQIFAGFGTSTLADAGQQWLAGVEYPLCRVNILNGTSTFQLVNDDFTQQNNGDFFVSLNGQERQGIIYGISTEVAAGAAMAQGVTVMPNPTTGMSEVVVNGLEDDRVELTLHDALGRLIWTTTTGATEGILRRSIDLTGATDGIYFLNVRTSTGNTTQRIVLARERTE